MPLIDGKYYRPDEVKINILVDSESKIAADREIGKTATSFATWAKEEVKDV